MPQAFGVKLLASIAVLASASSAFAFNETSCTGSINGKEFAKNKTVTSPSTLYRDQDVTVQLHTSENGEILLLALIKDRKPIDKEGETYLVRSQVESILQGSIASIKTDYTTPGDRRITSINVKCENEWGD